MFAVPNCDVELARIFPALSKYRVPEDAKGTVFVAPPTNWPTPVLENGTVVVVVPEVLPVPVLVPFPVPVVPVLLGSKAPGRPFPIAEYE